MLVVTSSQAFKAIESMATCMFTDAAVTVGRDDRDDDDEDDGDDDDVGHTPSSQAGMGEGNASTADGGDGDGDDGDADDADRADAAAAAAAAAASSLTVGTSRLTFDSAAIRSTREAADKEGRYVCRGREVKGACVGCRGT